LLQAARECVRRPRTRTRRFTIRRARQVVGVRHRVQALSTTSTSFAAEILAEATAQIAADAAPPARFDDPWQSVVTFF